MFRPFAASKASHGRRHVPGRWVAVVAVAAGMLAAPTIAVAPALASCTAAPAVEDAVNRADIVFVGRVVHLANRDRWATVEVEERWRGAAALGSTVEVHGGGDAGTTSPTDRSYELRRYLFTVGDGGDYLIDDLCTATTPWVGDLAGLRPAGVVPVPGIPDDSSKANGDSTAMLMTGAVFVALAIAVVAYLVILRSRGRPPDWFR